MRKLFLYFKNNKHRLATVALVFGFLVDIITFRNLDLTYALIILGAHLFIVASTIIILSLPYTEKEGSIFGSVRGWIPVLQQYSMGNLLSAFLVLYSASSSLIASWPFLALVAIAAIGNETLKLQKYRLPFQTSLFFLNVILYTALLLPVMLGSISVTAFLLSAVVAAFVFMLFRRALWLVSRKAFSERKRSINVGAVGMLIAVVVLYSTSLIPPIPLTLKHADFYYLVERSGSTYFAVDEDRGFFKRFFAIEGKTLRLTPGERAYVYTAVSAPARIDTNIVHVWEYYDETLKKWVQGNKVSYAITGGRKEGYRGFSLTENPTEGRWRVSVENTRGQVLGRSYVQIEKVEFSGIRTAFPLR